MINIKKIVVGNLNTNCYVVYDNLTKIALVIDPGSEFEKINSFIFKGNLNVKAVLLTHGHYDHIGACYKFKELNIPIYIHEKDADKCADNNLNLSNKFSEENINTFNADRLIIADEDKLNICGINVFALHTPGHSEGGCCYVIGNYLFSGDTIFEHGYGRIDFYDGSGLKLRQSIKKLLPYINAGYIVCDGHTN